MSNESSGQELSRLKFLLDNSFLVCPISKEPLHIKTVSKLETSSGLIYRIENNVPILLGDEKEAQRYVDSNPLMSQEYAEHDEEQPGPFPRWKRFLTNFGVDLDFRSPQSRSARKLAFDSLSDAKLVCVSIGGGPKRVHPSFINLNIGLFKNVDIVADAHFLPFRDESIDFIYCDAVLEHLSDPLKAVNEMFRVLKKGGKAYAITPFLQHFHGYPNHFQNFTETGHRQLFEKSGFRIDSSGFDLGPINALIVLIYVLTLEFLPKVVARFAAPAWLLLTYPLRSIDRWVKQRDRPIAIASTTYVSATKV